jgi:hypothetical protein
MSLIFPAHVALTVEQLPSLGIAVLRNDNPMPEVVENIRAA